MTLRTLLLLIFVALTGCASHCNPPKRAGPNVLFIVLDTVRADHMSAYGYERPTTPNLERFAKGATLYTRGMSNAAWTLPSHASMFTGKLPVEHKVHFRDMKKRGNETAFDGSVPTLAQTFKEMGYSTAGIIANNAYLSRRWGLWRGFETYYVERTMVDKHTAKAIEWLDEHKKESFFLFVNYMDVHGPYNRNPRPDVVGYAPKRGDHWERRMQRIVLPGDKDPPADLRRKSIDVYDTAMANLDTGLQTLFDWFEREGLLKETMVVITSDHGHFLGEHRFVGHPRDVYQATIHVPLFVKEPGQAKARVEDAVVMLHQLPHLILDGIGTPQARALLTRFPAKPGSAPSLAEQYWERGDDMRAHPKWGHRFDRVRRAWFEWPHKLIHSTDGQHELYNLETDPHEEQNLFNAESSVGSALVAKVEATVSGQAAPSGDDTTPLQFTEEEMERLKALGYAE